MKTLTNIYLEAIRFLAHLEDVDKPFELLVEGLDFAATTAVADAVRKVTGQEIEVDHFRAIDEYITGIVRPNCPDRCFEALTEAEEDFGEELGQLLQNIAFTFITAWTQRYGGVTGNYRVGG